jgi:hypothetical protein
LFAILAESIFWVCVLDLWLSRSLLESSLPLLESIVLNEARTAVTTIVGKLRYGIKSARYNAPECAISSAVSVQVTAVTKSRYLVPTVLLSP